MLDEYLALGGVELGNNARAFGYAECLSCCAGLLKLDGCSGLHDATGPFVNADWQWVTQARNLITSPVGTDPTWPWWNVGATKAVVPQGNEFTLTSATFDVGPPVDVAAGVQHAAGIVVESTFDTTVTVRWMPGGGLVSPSVIAATVSLVAGVPQYVTGTFTVGAGYAPYPGIIISGTSGVVGQKIKVTQPVVVVGPAPAPYFTGSTLPLDVDPATNRVSWEGLTDRSISKWEQYKPVTPSESLAAPYDCTGLTSSPWYDPDNPVSLDFAGFYLLSIKGVTDGTMTAPVTEGIDDGGVIGEGRYATKSVRVRTMLIGCGSLAAEYGLAWLKAALGRTFCGRHGDGCGTSDLTFFLDCPPSLGPTDPDYDATLAPFRRYLHGVGCTSAPIIVEEYLTPTGAYVIIVEYLLTAESPFVWGDMRLLASAGGILTAFDDIPFNLMRYPSGEVGDGIPAVVATQYAFNGSAEYGGSASALPTGWARTATNIAAGLTDAKSTDIAAVGPNAARVRLLATGAVSNGSIRLYYDVALGSMPGGSKPSLSMWAAALKFAGAPTLGTFLAEVEWRTASASLGTVPLGAIPLNGGNVSASGLTIPATATIARMAVTLSGINAVASDDVRVYADAFSLTVP